MTKRGSIMKNSFFGYTLLLLLFLCSPDYIVQAKKFKSSLLCNEPATKQDIQHQVECLIEMVREVEYTVMPISFLEFEKWPGNEMCIECNFISGLTVAGIEVLVLYLIITSVLQTGIFKSQSTLPSMNDENEKPKFQKLTLANVVGLLLASMGWLYYLVVVVTYWNFVSYLMLTGLILVGPSTFMILLQQPKSVKRDQLFLRRLTLAGWFLGGLTIGLFPNVSLMPSQIQRHLNPSLYLLQPDDELVIGLKQQFFEMYPQDDFYTKEFEDQMQMVDEFIYKTIQWKQDYSQYYMVGLLTSAHEVIERKAGDCQGQAVTTTSLLLSLGFEAWVVETPFHWWTMVRDEITGHVVFLNVHGSAGTLGNVLPQPIDLVYTRPKDSCTNCPSMFAHNQHPTLYISPPHRSIPLALTGAHIFVRSGWSWSDVSILALLEFTVAYGLGTTVYSSYYQADWNLSRMVKRGVIGTVLGAATMFGVTFWTTVFYPVTILHCIGIGTFALSFLTSDSLQTYL